MPNPRIGYTFPPGQPARPLRILIRLPDGARIYVLIQIKADGRIFLSAALRETMGTRNRSATTMVMWRRD